MILVAEKAPCEGRMWSSRITPQLGHPVAGVDFATNYSSESDISSFWGLADSKVRLAESRTENGEIDANTPRNGIMANRKSLTARAYRL